MKQQAQALDQGPVERRSHNIIVAEQGANMRVRLRVVDQTELDRLLHQRLISLDQHTAGDHLYRDMIRAGYFLRPRWLDDKGSGGGSPGVSHERANALVKMSLAKAWLMAGIGRRPSEYLLGVVLGERTVTLGTIPLVRSGLNSYQGFDSWWQGRDTAVPVPELLRDLPPKVKKMRPWATGL